MLTVSGLYTYPIKSCGRLAHTQVTLGERGLAYDRHWLITDASGQFLTQREYPRMALIQPSLAGDGLQISAPNIEPLTVPLTATPDMPRLPVTVWKDTFLAAAVGHDADAWFSTVLGADVRFWAMPPEVQRPVSNKYNTGADAHTGFADGYPILVISEESLDDLNTRLLAHGSSAVAMQNFRPNVVVKGLTPFIEDEMADFDINGIRFNGVKPCARCAITTVDPTSGEIPNAKEPLGTLATFRRGANGGVMFGQNVIHRSTGTLAVGATVTLYQ